MSYQINKDYDIPYVGGYSRDGKIIYIDKNLPETFITSTGEEHSLHYFLTIHEITEVGLMQTDEYSFNEAHKIAVEIEVASLFKNNVPVDEYYGHIFKYTQAAISKYKSGMSTLPIDLDMRPYIEDNITIEVIPGGKL